MSIQFNRKYELLVIPESGEALSITGLRIAFEITKSMISTPNLAKISIYNLNEETLKKLRVPFVKILFKVGYENSNLLVFSGQLRNVYQVRNSVDMITELYSGDGELDIKNSTYNKTVSPNVTILNTVTDIIATFKESTIGVLDGIPDIADKILGQTLSGKSKDILDMYAEEYGFQWSIQDGEVVAVADKKEPDQNTAILVNSRTGMIGTPTVTEIGADVTTLLNPRFKANGSFKIESDTANVELGNTFFRDIRRTSAEGYYRLQEVVHSGDTHSDKWQSACKGLSLNV